MYDYNSAFLEDSDYKSEFFEDLEFDWEDYDIEREKEEVYNLMTLREATRVLETWGEEFSELAKVTSKTVDSINKIIKEYEKLEVPFNGFNPRN